MAVLRRILDVSLRDRRRNLDSKKELDINLSIVQIIQKRRLSYFGHVVRMNEERYPNMLLCGQIEGSRPRGRPRKKWIDNTKEDCSDMDLTVVEANHLARDRSRWRILLYRSWAASARLPCPRRQGIKLSKSKKENSMVPIYGARYSRTAVGFVALATYAYTAVSCHHFFDVFAPSYFLITNMRVATEECFFSVMHSCCCLTGLG